MILPRPLIASQLALNAQHASSTGEVREAIKQLMPPSLDGESEGCHKCSDSYDPVYVIILFPHFLYMKTF